MRLLIISSTPHYNRGQTIVGWGPTVMEIDALATIFDEITHLGCLYQDPAPFSALPYRSANIQFIPMHPSGGETLGAKIGILKLVPEYAATIQKWLRWADAVHVRCPANIPLIALAILAVNSSGGYRWAKYAGNWRPVRKDPLSYTLQRMMLRNKLHRGVVTVNGSWPNQPDHVFSFLNPCLTIEEIVNARECTVNKTVTEPFRLLFVGALKKSKGVETVLQTLALLKSSGIDFRCDFVGDSPKQSEFQVLAQDLGICQNVEFHGWLPRTSLGMYYSQAHCILLPSGSEGWPKVLSEAMAYGCVALASPVSSIPEILQKTGAGQAIPSDRPDLYARAVMEFIQQPTMWKQYSDAGLASASFFSYETYLTSVRGMFQKAWNISFS